MEPLTTISLAAALSSIVGTIVSIVLNLVARSSKLRSAENHELEEVLRKDDLDSLAAFMDQTVGQFDVSEYVGSSDVRRLVDRYLDGVVAFTGTDQDVEEDERVSVLAKPSGTERWRALQSEPLAQVISYLDAGETWNALALLRRTIEIELRRMAQKLDYKERHLRSAGQILRLLMYREEISPEAFEALRYVIAVCNRAVHGRDVTVEEAHKAFLLAERWLDVSDA